MNSRKRIVLFGHCFVVKGFQNTIICDLQRNAIFTINNGIYEILTKYKGNIEKTKAKYEENIHPAINQGIDFLLNNELAFYTENPEWFPSVNLEWQNPSVITNAILELRSFNYISFLSIVDQLEHLGCKQIELRLEWLINFNDLLELLSVFDERKIRNIYLILNFQCRFSIFQYKEILLNYQRVGLLTIHSSPIVFLKKIENDVEIPDNIEFISKKIDNCNICGVVSDRYFNANVELFTEAQYHNTCLNRKISIDANGDIKNCPSMSESFGNIKDTTLEEAINKPGFKKYWNINKDQIHVCKDCEFRYICTDCRAYIEDPEDIYSKPLKCGYNPYTGEWEEWSTNPLKQKAIDYYGMQDLVKRG